MENGWTDGRTTGQHKHGPLEAKRTKITDFALCKGCSSHSWDAIKKLKKNFFKKPEFEFSKSCSEFHETQKNEIKFVVIFLWANALWDLGSGGDACESLSPSGEPRPETKSQYSDLPIKICQKFYLIFLRFAQF